MIYFPDRMGSIYDCGFSSAGDPLRWPVRQPITQKVQTPSVESGTQDDPSAAAEYLVIEGIGGTMGRAVRKNGAATPTLLSFERCLFATKPCSRLRHSLSDNPVYRP